MGISGLLPFLENAATKGHVAQFRGETVAIDAYCWLHKGVFGCAEKLARGEDTNGYVLYCMKYIKMLQSYGIRPIMVFDGQHLPAKKLTEEKRREQRQSSKKKAAELLRLGHDAEARKFILRSVDITHTMALNLIKECRRNGVDCIVAPYEADPQLAYLNILGIVQFVITEDSDLLLFGCKKIFFKMDIRGFGTMVEAEKINNCMKLRGDKYSFDKFRYMCILSGCDYLESLPGVGIKKALKFVSLTENPSIYNILPKVPIYLKLSNVEVTDEYRENFMLADATFQHQLVFDPIKRCLLPLNPVSSDFNMDYCKNAGNMTDNNLAFQLALGNIDPFTHKKVDDWNPDTASLSISSIWSKNFHKQKVKVASQNVKRITSPIKSKPPLNGFKPVAQETPDSHDLEIDEMLDMYRQLGPATKPKDDEVKDLYTALHGDTDKSSKRCSSGFLKHGPTVVDYENGVVSRFFKPKEEKYEGDSQEPMVSLLGAIDNIIKKRKSIENDCRNDEKCLEVMKRKKSDIENTCGSVLQDEVDVGGLKRRFNFRKEKLSSLRSHDVSLNSNNNDEICVGEIVVTIEENEESVTTSIVQEDLSVQKSIESVVSSLRSKCVVGKQEPKKQSTLLKFFSKQ